MWHTEGEPSKLPSGPAYEKAEPDDLLEQTWFFGNLLDKETKGTLSRSYSDRFPSSTEKDELSKKKTNLVRAPSLPLSMGREKAAEGVEGDSGNTRKNNSLRKMRASLNRPHLYCGEEDAESEFSLSRLIRQASLSSSDELPPKHNSKGIKQCLSARRYHRHAEPLPESNGTEACNETRTQSLKIQPKLRKSLSDVRMYQIQGLEGMGSKLDKRDLNPIENLDLQEKMRMGSGADKLRGSCQRNVPNRWADKSSSPEDMKAQIRCWARAVAANVR